MPSAEYLPRLADERLVSLLRDLPAVMLTGPRAAGKTTSARRLAADVLRLDDPAAAAAVAANPDAALRRSREPVLIDEWQQVPEVLGAVKRAVDDDPRPGRFLLTGSGEADLTQQTWPGTGRVVRLVLHGLTEREISGRVDGPGLLDVVIAGDLAAVGLPATVPDVDGYIARALRSGFPEAVLRMAAPVRESWLDGYLDNVIYRDARAVGSPRDPVLLRRYLEVLGLSTAGLPADATLYSAADINLRTARAYDRLLASLYLLDLVPAWSSNRLSRLVKRPKRYLEDAALAATAARADQRTILGDGDLLGRFLDTFVAAQLRPEVDLRRPRARLHHLRTDGGRQEVDLVVDLGVGQVIGVEVKAGTAPSVRDARHLAWMRDELGDGFVRGVIFHAGPYPFEVGERIWALPICALWGRHRLP